MNGARSAHFGMTDVPIEFNYLQLVRMHYERHTNTHNTPLAMGQSVFRHADRLPACRRSEMCTDQLVMLVCWQVFIWIFRVIRVGRICMSTISICDSLALSQHAHTHTNWYVYLHHSVNKHANALTHTHTYMSRKWFFWTWILTANNCDFMMVDERERSRNE